MGYAHGTRWTEEKIIEQVKYVMEVLKIDTMPTHTQMEKATGSCGLSNAISKRGGTQKFANILGIECKPSESRIGEEYECMCIEHITNMGFECEKMKVGYPYDVLVQEAIKVEVKVSRLYSNNIRFYAFNLEKSKPTCDVFVFYCTNDNGDILRTYIIPSAVLSGKCQLSIGELKSKYDGYIDKWGYIEEFVKFNNLIVNGL